MHETSHSRNAGEPARKFRILVLDDHPVIREGLALMIEQERDLSVCGKAEDGNQAMKLVAATAPDLVLADLGLARQSGLDFIKQLKASHPGIPALVLSMFEEATYAERVLRAGAKGYLMKQESPQRVIDAIRAVLKGGIHLSEIMKGRMLEKIASGRGAFPESPEDQLSDRELEVFQCMGRGWGTRQIAEALNLSIKTVETHFAHIKKKMDLGGQPELMYRAVSWVQSQNPL